MRPKPELLKVILFVSLCMRPTPPCGFTQGDKGNDGPLAFPVPSPLHASSQSYSPIVLMTHFQNFYKKTLVLSQFKFCFCILLSLQQIQDVASVVFPTKLLSHPLYLGPATELCQRCQGSKSVLTTPSSFSISDKHQHCLYCLRDITSHLGIVSASLSSPYLRKLGSVPKETPHGGCHGTSIGSWLENTPHLPYIGLNRR